MCAEQTIRPPRRAPIGGLVYHNRRKQGLLNWLNKEDHIFIRPSLAHFTGNWSHQDSIWSVPLTDLPLRGSEAMQEYERRIRNTPQLWNTLPSLEGKVLGCTCRAHNNCHGDVLVRLFWERELSERFNAMALQQEQQEQQQQQQQQQSQDSSYRGELDWVEHT